MLRFILNFFLFGLLFYLIYLFFPETFATLVSWADKTYLFFHDLFLQLSERIQGMRSPPAQAFGIPPIPFVVSSWIKGLK